MTKFGVYTHSRPDGRAFYVGKGTFDRAKWMKRNRYHDRIVAKYGADNIKVKFMPCIDENDAFAAEVELISFLRQEGVELTNMTDGGEGVAGLVFTVEAREKMSASAKGKIISDVTRARISASTKGKVVSAETRAKLAEASRIRSPEARAKMSAANLGRPLSAEHKAKLSASHTGKVNSAETRAKISTSNKGKERSPEFSIRMRELNIGKKLSKESIDRQRATKRADRAEMLALLDRGY